MIFGLEMYRAVLAGKKTQTRRFKCRYEPGKSYALQPGRGKEAKHRITITEVRQERLGDITLRDARKEGFRTTQDFRDYWTKLYQRFNPDAEIYVISFELGDTTDAPRLLGRHPGHDYVSSTAQALPNTAEEISAHTQAIYTKESEQGLRIARMARYEASRAQLIAAINEIRPYASQRANDKLRGIERQVRSLDKCV